MTLKGFRKFRSRFSQSGLKWVQFGLVCGLGLAIALTPPLLPRLPLQAPLRLLSKAISHPVQAITSAPRLDKAIDGFSTPHLWVRAARLAAKLGRFGHLPYSKASQQQLVPFTDDQWQATLRAEYVDRTAQPALKQLIDAARKDGISIVLISGFRDFAIQNMLFQGRAEQLGSAAAAAKSVAPPGYSEHHTGYAVDLADANQDFRNFGDSPAFRWMTLHAHEFGFELSFPPNNPQGVDYEPWHWRFVGSAQAAKTFELAEELQQ